MRKKTIRIIVGILLVVTLLFILNSQGIIKLPLAISTPSDLSQAVGSCSGGWTTLSTSSVSIVPSGDRIRVYGQARGSECLSIKLTQSGLDALLNFQGFDATKDITMNVRLLQYNKIFPIDTTGSYSGNFNNLVVSGSLLSSASIQWCVNKGYPTTIYAYKPTLSNIRCVIPGQNGIAGGFVASRSYGDFDVLFDLNGQQVHLTKNAQSAQIGNNYIEWTGNLLNLDEVYPPQYDARLIGSKWDLVGKGASQDINNALNSFVNCMTTYASDSKFDYCKGLFDTRSSQIFTSKLSDYQTQASNLVYDVSTDSNALYVSLKAPPFPTFILDLDAISVGIIALQGKPQIIQCISAGVLSSGQNKIVSYSVKNNANANNVQFTSSITCNQGVSPYSTSFNIGSMETKTLTAELIPSNPNQNELSYSCTLKVIDLKSGASDSCGFSGVVKYVSGTVCTPNQLRCSDNGQNILRCTSDGKNFDTLQQCQYGCISNQTGVQCVGQSPPLPPPGLKCDSCDAYVKSQTIGWLFPSQQCEAKTFLTIQTQNNATCIFSWLKLLVVPLAFILTLLFGINTANKFKKKNMKYILIISTILISALVGYLVYALFFIGIILAIIFLIASILIRIFVPFK